MLGVLKLAQSPTPSIFSSDQHLCPRLGNLQESTRHCRNLPEPAQNYSKLPNRSKNFHKLPKTSRAFFQNIPKTSKNYTKLPKTSKNCQSGLRFFFFGDPYPGKEMLRLQLCENSLSAPSCSGKPFSLRRLSLPIVNGRQQTPSDERQMLQAATIVTTDNDMQLLLGGTFPGTHGRFWNVWAGLGS